jgi:hypothetical protein
MDGIIMSIIDIEKAMFETIFDVLDNSLGKRLRKFHLKIQQIKPRNIKAAEIICTIL